jgi:signal peptide peptidase SppA
VKLLDIMTGLWAIRPDYFQQIIGIYNGYVLGPKLDFAEIDRRVQEARGGRPMGRARREMIGQVTPEGVAVLDLEGPLAKRMSAVNNACEGTSTNLIADFFQQALEDPQVKGILLNIDSPGGTVDGTMDLARRIHAARGQKPIVALADGQACSAAYWIGAAADAFYITNDTAFVGSIGVVFTHVDQSKALEKAGLVVTEVTAGQYKRAISSVKPLDEAGKAQLQEWADQIYTSFVEDVSTFRGVPVEQVLEQMANGRVFLGQKAIEAGLVDGVSTLDDLVSQLAQGRAPGKAGAGAAHSPATPSLEDSMKITREQLAADQPDLLESLLAEGHAAGLAEASADQDAKMEAAKAEHAKALAEAVAAETARVKGVLAAGLAGHEALTEQLAFDGKTTPEQAALQINQAEKAKGTARLAELAKERGGAAVAHGGDPVGGAAPASKDDLRARWESRPSLRNLYGSFEAYEKACEQAEAAAANGRISQKGR